jgi:hypothetical protein
MDTRIPNRSLALLGVALVGVALLAAPAGADDDEDAPAVPMIDRHYAEAPTVEDGPVPIYPILITVLGVAIVCLVAFKNSKRTHLD